MADKKVYPYLVIESVEPSKDSIEKSRFDLGIAIGPFGSCLSDLASHSETGFNFELSGVVILDR